VGKCINLKGKKFSRLTVLNKAGSSKHKKVLWLCECDCGTQIVTTSGDLNSGNTKSCGCLHKEIDSEAHTTHGMCGTPEYRSWAHMKERCANPNNKDFLDYGGRGIGIKKEWLVFESFFADMGLKAHPDLTIERVDNEKGYSKENCIWASRVVQSRNQRIPKNNTSGYAGVYFCKKSNSHRSYIDVGGHRIHLGFFPTIEEAIEARKQGELKYWAEDV